MSVLCIGQLVADVVVRPVNSLPAPGTTVLVEDLQLVAGGCAANTASVLAKLGAQVSAFGMVGHDSLGEVIMSQLAVCGVDASGVIRNQLVPTSAVVVAVDQYGERSFMYRAGGNEQLTSGLIASHLLSDHDFVHIGGAMKLVSFDLTDILVRSKQERCTTSLDTDWDPTGNWMSTLGDALPHVDYLLTNVIEGRMLTGLNEARDIGRALLERGPRAVIVKCGAAGAVAVTREMTKCFSPFEVQVLDTTCAGDAFSAGFLHAISQHWSLEEAVVFGNAVGALCTTQISHAGVTSFEDTMRFIGNHPVAQSLEYPLFKCVDSVGERALRKT